MSTSHHRFRTVDQTSGAVQRQAKPSTVGNAQRGAEALRASNVGSSRRAGPGTTQVQGLKFTGKTAKVAADWAKDALRVAQMIPDAVRAKKAADALEGTGFEDPEVIKRVRAFLECLGAAIQSLVGRAEELLVQAADEQGDIDTSGKVVAHETNTGEAPRSAAELRAEVGDAGRSVVLDHLAAVSIGDPGTYTNPYVVDGLKIERARQHASEIVTALNPERVRQGLDDEVLRDFSQLSFMRPAH